MRFGSIVLAAVVGLLLRLVTPLDVVSFPLYLPLIFLLSLTFGWGPGLLAMALADLFTGLCGFDGAADGLARSQVIALVHYLPGWPGVLSPGFGPEAIAHRCRGSMNMDQ